ncbi:hypothetical protein D0Y65_001353 [Glycine soja]|uniref:Uncharacterized protein n=1 Tax=Glycine soja TaxID=3848 RepID=A0A445M289_GLYSO|nr:hypothetical protein D0Y65_001353 [Glycine soja]
MYVVFNIKVEAHSSSFYTKDSFDDIIFFLGNEVPNIINVEPVFTVGSIPETSYNVVKDQKYCGEIKVALTFNPERGSGLGYGDE